MARTFEIKSAKRAEVPILCGLFGASSSGKTWSALRIATGMQKVRGGKIVVIDTESRRALHYADSFAFEHMDFGAPFAPLDYLEAIKAAVSAGARVLVVDSASHMHEGPGGLLSQHDEEVTRMAGNDWKKRERVNMAGWIKPKREFQEFKNELLQLNVAVVMCFRAKQKIKPVQGGQPKELGWMPIISDELTFEMTLNALLLPGSDGVPSWSPEEKESRERIKLPNQFREWFLRRKAGKPLDEDDGVMLAKWAAGESTEPERKQPDPVAPVFRERIEWDGQSEYGGKPLSSAGIDALTGYFDAVTAISKMTNLRPHVRDEIAQHLRDITAAIASKEPAT